MSKFDEAVATYTKAAAEWNLGLDAELITAVAKSLGPVIYNTDSSLVSSSDKTETDRVKTNFLVGKLGLPDNAELDAALTEAWAAFGTSNKSKHRVLVYAWLAKRFGKEAIYA